MANLPRVEDKDFGCLVTIRCRNSELWFVNNPALTNRILGLVAKYTTKYKVHLYSVTLQGSHIHLTVKFPLMNRAAFMRDLNSNIARAVKREYPQIPEGSFFARRYSAEILPHADDIEDRTLYTILQPVKDGLVQRLGDYHEYSCLHDAAYGIVRKFKVVRWGEYYAALRHDPSISIKDFTDIVELKLQRLPGKEDLSQKEYAQYFLNIVEKRRLQYVTERLNAGKGFVGQEKLRLVKPGTRAKNPKRSTRESKRPRVLSICKERWSRTMKWFFEKIALFKDASRRFRSGELDAVFPEGMYRPCSSCCIAATG